MSSDKKGVQAELAKDPPNAEYQGCCLHSINLVICHACKINSIQNMMDSCHELFSFFDGQEVSFQLVSKFICVNFLFLLNICKAECQRNFFVF